MKLDLISMFIFLICSILGILGLIYGIKKDDWISITIGALNISIPFWFIYIEILKK